MHLVNTAAVPQYAGLKYSGDDTDARHHKRQVSLTSGTLFAETKLPLRTWLTGFVVEKHLWPSTC